MFKKYIRNILISIDQFVNTILGGDPDETLSVRLGKHYQGSFMEIFVDYLFGNNHCENSAEAEKDEGNDAIIR